MTTFGITDQGFTLKRLSDILLDMSTALNGVVDLTSGQNLTPDLADENDPLVQVINAFADSVSVCWEQLQLAYNEFDPLKATGAGLSGLVQLNNLTRRLGGYATATFACTGTPYSTILAGVQISNSDATIIFTLAQFTFDSSGNAIVTGTCTTKGNVVMLAGEMNTIATPTNGILTAVNTTDSDGGSDDETDADLRARQQESTSGTARSVIDAAYSVLAGLPGVTNVKVFQNSTLYEDSRGIPGKSIAVVIMGGYDNDISQSLFSVIPLGASTYGSTSTTQIDTNGVSYPVNFSRPAEVSIYIEVNIEIIDSSLWSDDSVTNIKDAIILWADEGAAGLGITDGYDRTGYLPGRDVWASEFYTPVNKQAGIVIDSIYIGTTCSPAASHVGILWNEIAAFSSDNITVNYETGESS